MIASSALAAITKPIGSCCSSARCASRLAVRARIGTALTVAEEKPRSSITAAIDRVAQAPREQHVRTAHPALVGELEDALGARIERAVDRVAEARHPLAAVAHALRGLSRHLLGCAARRDLGLRRFEHPRARLGGPE